MQMGLVMARVLNRTLAFSGFLNMRKCINPKLCKDTTCISVPRGDGTYAMQCPHSKLYEKAEIEERGVRFFDSEGEMLQGRTSFHDNSAFDDLYNPATFPLDRFDKSIKKYFELKFSCENIPNEIRHNDIPFAELHAGIRDSSANSKKTNKADHGIPSLDVHELQSGGRVLLDFSSKYGKHDEEILYLHGTPHVIGRMPFYWSSHKALYDSMQSWVPLQGSYSMSVKMFSTMLEQSILSKSKTKSFVCLHIRRGDFIELGWAPKILNTKSIISAVKNMRLDSGEAVYIATDDISLYGDQELQKEIEGGPYFWSDFENEIVAQGHPDTAMLGWQDYIGLVEVSTCSRARRFSGTHCSSFSGSVVNLKRSHHGSGVNIATLA